MKLISQHSFPAHGGRSPGTIVLCDAGPEEGHRYVTYWRNDELGGHSEGGYHPTLAEGVADFDARVADEMRRRPALVPSEGTPFQVDLWGSHPSENNDDCLTGDDYATFEEAIKDLRRLQAQPSRDNWAYAVIKGPDGTLHEEYNLDFKPGLDDDDEARSEFANMQGMAYGSDAYNEAMGQEIEEGPSYGR